MDGALTGDEQTRRQLDEEMEARRDKLGITWRQVADDGGVHYETLRAARKGRAGIPEQTRRAIERGLRWQKFSVDSILRGGEPTPLPTVQATEQAAVQQPDALDLFFNRLRDRVLTMSGDQLVELLEMFPDIPEAERYQLLRRLTRLKAERDRTRADGDDLRESI